LMASQEHISPVCTTLNEVLAVCHVPRIRNHEPYTP